MISQAFTDWRTVTDAYYWRRDDQPADELVIHFGDDEYHCPNTGFSCDNPVLQLCAYSNARPSTIEDELVGKVLPVVEQQSDAYSDVVVADYVFENGKWSLQESTWGPDV